MENPLQSKRNISKLNALAGLDSTFVKENPDFVSAYKDINWKNIDTLNKLLKVIDVTLKKYPTPNPSIKASIALIFSQILSVYPLLFGYWKKFTSIQYQLHDLSTSLETLENGTKAFPHSLELWCDYLRVLTVNYPNDIEKIRSKMELAKSLIGWQFYSHTFWDLVIAFEKQQGSDLTPLYWHLVKIPLHQYSKYVEPFKQLLTNKEDRSELDRLVKSNQANVLDIWKYESKIKQSFFNLVPLPQQEIDNWDKYTTHLIDSKKQNELIVSVFERCLIPCCFIESFWVKYAGWSAKNGISSLHTTLEIYKRGNKTLPKEDRTLRLEFLKYLKRHLKNDKNEFIFNLITENIAEYMVIWPYHASTLMAEYLPILKRVKFQSNIKLEPKQILRQQTAYATFLDRSITNFLNDKVDRSVQLQDMLSDLNIAVVVVELIKLNWLVLKNNLQTRKYFNFFSKFPVIRRSTPFWLTYYKFEKSSKNFTKLNKFINELGVDIVLPTTVINDLIKDYKTFYLLNSNIVDYEKPSSIDDKFHKQTMVDPIFYSQFKINNPRWKLNQYPIEKNELYKSSEFKENGHTGIKVDRPEITNSILEKDTSTFKNVAPVLPAFRNLEKINQPLKYNDYYMDDYVEINRAK